MCLSEKVSVCHRQYVSVRGSLCLFQIVCFVTDSLCLSQTVCVCPRKVFFLSCLDKLERYCPFLSVSGNFCPFPSVSIRFFYCSLLSVLHVSVCFCLFMSISVHMYVFVHFCLFLSVFVRFVFFCPFLSVSVPIMVQSCP